MSDTQTLDPPPETLSREQLDRQFQRNFNQIRWAVFADRQPEDWHIRNYEEFTWQRLGTELLDDILSGNVRGSGLGDQQLRNLAQYTARLTFGMVNADDEQQKAAKDLAASLYDEIGGEAFDRHLGYLDPKLPGVVSSLPVPRPGLGWRVFIGAAKVVSAGWEYGVAPLLGNVTSFLRGEGRKSRRELDISRDGFLSAGEVLRGEATTGGFWSLNNLVDIGVETAFDPGTWMTFGIAGATKQSLKAARGGLKKILPVQNIDELVAARALPDMVGQRISVQDAVRQGSIDMVAQPILARWAKVIGSDGVEALPATDAALLTKGLFSQGLDEPMEVLRAARAESPTGYRSLLEGLEEGADLRLQRALQSTPAWGAEYMDEAMNLALEEGTEKWIVASAAEQAAKHMRQLHFARKGVRFAPPGQLGKGHRIAGSQHFALSNVLRGLWKPGAETFLTGERSIMRAAAAAPFKRITPRAGVTARFGIGVAEEWYETVKQAHSTAASRRIRNPLSDSALRRIAYKFIGEKGANIVSDEGVPLVIARSYKVSPHSLGEPIKGKEFGDFIVDNLELDGLLKDASNAPLIRSAVGVGEAGNRASAEAANKILQATGNDNLWQQARPRLTKKQAETAGQPTKARQVWWDDLLSDEGKQYAWKEFRKKEYDRIGAEMDMPDPNLSARAVTEKTWDTIVGNQGVYRQLVSAGDMDFAVHHKLLDDLQNNVLGYHLSELMTQTAEFASSWLSMLQRFWSGSALSMLRGPQYTVTNFLGGMMNAVVIGGLDVRSLGKNMGRAFELVRIHREAIKRVKAAHKLRKRFVLAFRKRSAKGGVPEWEPELLREYGINSEDELEEGLLNAVTNNQMTEEQAQIVRELIDMHGWRPLVDEPHLVDVDGKMVTPSVAKTYQSEMANYRKEMGVFERRKKFFQEYWDETAKVRKKVRTKTKTRVTAQQKKLQNKARELRRAIKQVKKTGDVTTKVTLDKVDADTLLKTLGRRRGSIVKRHNKLAEKEALEVSGLTASRWNKKDLASAKRRVTALRKKIKGGGGPIPGDGLPVPDYMLDPSKVGTRLYEGFERILGIWADARRTGDAGVYDEAISEFRRSYDFFQERFHRTLSSMDKARAAVGSGKRGEDYLERAIFEQGRVRKLYGRFIEYVEDVAMPMLKEERAAAAAGKPKFAPNPKQAADLSLEDDLAKAQAKVKEITQSLETVTENEAYKKAYDIARAKYPDPSVEDLIDNLLQTGDISDAEAEILRQSLEKKRTDRVFPTAKDIEAAIADVDPEDIIEGGLDEAKLKDELNKVEKQLQRLKDQGLSEGFVPDDPTVVIEETGAVREEVLEAITGTARGDAQKVADWVQNMTKADIDPVKEFDNYWKPREPQVGGGKQSNYIKRSYSETGGIRGPFYQPFLQYFSTLQEMGVPAGEIRALQAMNRWDVFTGRYHDVVEEGLPVWSQENIREAKAVDSSLRGDHTLITPVQGQDHGLLYIHGQVADYDVGASAADRELSEKRAKRQAFERRVSNFLNWKRGKEINLVVEDTLRATAFLAGEEKWGSWAAAADGVRRSQFDYSDLTATEYKFKTSVNRFYTYPRNLLGKMTEHLMHAPGRVLGQMDMVEGVGEWIMDVNLDGDYADFGLPKFLQDMDGVLHVDGVAAIIRTPLHEYLQLVSMLRGLSFGAFDRGLPDRNAWSSVFREGYGSLTAGMVTSLIKAGLEEGSGVDLFTGGTLRNDTTMDRLLRWTGVVAPGHTTGAKNAMRIYEGYGAGHEEGRRDATVRLYSTLTGVWARSTEGSMKVSRLRELESDLSDAIMNVAESGGRIELLTPEGRTIELDSPVLTFDKMRDLDLVIPGQRRRAVQAYGVEKEEAAGDEIDPRLPEQIQRRHPTLKEQMAYISPYMQWQMNELGADLPTFEEGAPQYRSENIYTDPVLELAILKEHGLYDPRNPDHIAAKIRRAAHTGLLTRAEQREAGITAPVHWKKPAKDSESWLDTERKMTRYAAAYGVRTEDLQRVAPYLTDVRLEQERLLFEGYSEEEIQEMMMNDLPDRLKGWLTGEPIIEFEEFLDREEIRDFHFAVANLADQIGFATVQRIHPTVARVLAMASLMPIADQKRIFGGSILPSPYKLVIPRDNAALYNAYTRLWAGSIVDDR